ncbi:MAG: flagellar export chaperone FliS [Verrucomicrobiia bacterium]|jgi:flagellar protein FliS
MTQANALKSYKTVATQTAAPGNLVLMLYDGALRFLQRAVEFNQGVNNNILRAQSIINELNTSLDMDQGGELADKLRGLYNYFDERLQEGNIAKEQQPVDEVIDRLNVIRDAWREMLAQQQPPELAAA